jgi:hypothetical protein
MSYVKKTHRFGLLTPSSNTTQEPEFSAALPPTVSLHTGRVAYRDITPEEQMRCVLELESESRKLADAEVDAIVFAATAPTLAKGKGYDRELIKRMEDASGKPATTAATAFVDALTRIGAGKIAIGGTAWAQTRGITKVEVQIDSGPWTEAVLSDEASLITWRQWSLDWDATPGPHYIKVRATDGTGEVQTDKRADPVPDGASGWQSVMVTVE